MLRLVLKDAQQLHAAARERKVETCAVGLVHAVGGARVPPRFLVRELAEVPVDAYLSRTPTTAVLNPGFCTQVVNRARAANAGLVFAHTHPGSGALDRFSSVDDFGESALVPFLERRLPLAAHFAAVFTVESVSARRLGENSPVPVVRVGRDLFAESGTSDPLEDQYDRQVRAFGIDGQKVLASLTVAIVGVGGTGSAVAQQLAHLGVRAFVLIDPDLVEKTNLNRLIGSRPSDIGKQKVSVAARLVNSINPSATVASIVGDVTDEQTAQILVDVDFVFGCTDSMSSRAVMNQLAYQYLIPYIDVGVGIWTRGGVVDYIAGRAQMLSPGLPCMVCTDKLDAEQVRRELLTAEQLRKDPYIAGASEPQPAVISLNSTVSSVAVTMFLATVTGIRSDARMLTYDAIHGSMRPVVATPRSKCIVCSTEGALGRGTAWSLPTRPNGKH